MIEMNTNSTQPSRCLEVTEQIKVMNDAKLFYDQFKLNPKTKYLSDYENRDTYKEGEMILYSNKNTICLVIYKLLCNNYSPSVFLTSLIEYKPIIRDGVIHNALCEYAIGDTCNCPCNEKYHGWKGTNLQ